MKKPSIDLQTLRLPALIDLIAATFPGLGGAPVYARVEVRIDDRPWELPR